MELVPIWLMVDPNAEPVTLHTPVTVPPTGNRLNHLKAELNKDVALGVLEPVPVGQLATWCHCMVLCEKRNCKS